MTEHQCNDGCDGATHLIRDGETLTDRDTGRYFTTAGGWCAPTADVLGDLATAATESRGLYADAITMPRIELPEVSALRVGMEYRIPTPAERTAREHADAIMRRAIERMLLQRHEAVELAAFTAYLGGWDLHVYEPPQLTTLRPLADDLYIQSFVGIEFRERDTGRSFPTIHEHRSSFDVLDWDDD